MVSIHPGPGHAGSHRGQAYRLVRIRKRKPAGIRVLVDIIQLSATLRTAVPYRINVDQHLVDPLLAAPRAHQESCLLHVSDLHLVAELDEAGRKLVRPALTPTHSFEAARYVASAVAALQPRYDALVATGDLTTDGARGSFETVLQYVQSGSITGANPMRIAAYGLNASRSQRILLPGNHDRYAAQKIPGQRLDFTCEEVLQIPRRYPYMLGYRPFDKEDWFAILFLVFDSNLQQERGLELQSRRLDRRAGQGGGEGRRVDRGAHADKGNAGKGEVERIGGGTLKFDASKTIRVALLHHHPVTKYVVPKPPRRSPRLGSAIKAFVFDSAAEYRRRRPPRTWRWKAATSFLACCWIAASS